MNHLKKIYAVILAMSMGCAYAMETPSRVPSLQDFCIAQVAEQFFDPLDTAIKKGIQMLRDKDIYTRENLEKNIENELMSATYGWPPTVAERVILKWMGRYAWKMAPEKRVLHCYPGAGKYEIAWNHKGDLLASSAENNNVIVWKYEDGEFSRAHELGVNGSAIQSMVWHPSKNKLAFGLWYGIHQKISLLLVWLTAK